MPKHTTPQPTQRPGARLTPRLTPRPLIVRPPLTQEVRNRRSDELAHARGMAKYAARHTREDFDDAGAISHIQFRVESATRADVEYYVDWYAFLGNAYCNCPAGLADQPCWHCGSARAAGASIAAIIAYEQSPEGRADMEQEARDDAAIEQWRDEMYSRERERGGR